MLSERLQLKFLLQKFAADLFPARQLSFRESFRIVESIDMERAAKKIIEYFLIKNEKTLADSEIKIFETEALLFEDDYSWYEAMAKGEIKTPSGTYFVTVNLTDGDIWTVTLDSQRRQSFNTPSPSYVESPVRQIVERYRRKKYLKSKPAKPFRKKPTLVQEDLLGFPPFKERK